MKIAVVQHSLRPAPAQDLEVLVIATARAAAAGAELVILPDVAALSEGPLGDDLYRRIEDGAPGLDFIVAHSGDSAAPAHHLEGLGTVVLLAGDACIDADVLRSASAEAPGLVVLAPGSESELQAEAILEHAIALSTSLASAIVVVETDGAQVGEPGHGGSAIVHLGQVLAEAGAGDDILLADLAVPLGPPEAHEALPAVSPLLQQRVAVHRGLKVDVDYPADLG